VDRQADQCIVPEQPTRIGDIASSREMDAMGACVTRQLRVAVQSDCGAIFLRAVQEPTEHRGLLGWRQILFAQAQPAAARRKSRFRDAGNRAAGLPPVRNQQ
jgi:hypothetical protein